MEMTIEEIIRKAKAGEEFHVPVALMPAYIRYLYTTNPCISGFLGIKVEDVARGRVTLGMELRHEHSNIHGFLYGGILAAMADAMALGLISSVGKLAVTTDLSMNFIHAAAVPGYIRLRGKVRHDGGRMVMLAGEIRDAHEVLLADIQVSMLVLRRRPEVPEIW